MIAETIIAGGALTLTLYGIYATHRHNRLSVAPHIVACRGKDRRDDGLVLSYDLCNHGIGPARIKRLSLFLDKVPFATPEKAEPIEALIAARVAGRLRYVLRRNSFPGPGYSIIAGQSYRIAEVFLPGVKVADEERVDEVLSGLDLRVEYESFYGVPYVFDTRERG